MENKPIIVSNGNLEGNVGQCKVNVNNITIDPWHERSIGINSCTGETVADYTYLNFAGMGGSVFSAVFSAGAAVTALIFLLVFGIALIGKIFRW